MVWVFGRKNFNVWNVGIVFVDLNLWRVYKIIFIIKIIVRFCLLKENYCFENNLMEYRGYR